MLRTFATFAFVMVTWTAADARPADWEDVTSDFCTALQASSVCSNVQMRLGTEAAMVEEFGYEIRGAPGDDVAHVCMRALIAFEGSQAECREAWQLYGCAGSDRPRLLQENPFRDPNARLCPYD